MSSNKRSTTFSFISVFWYVLCYSWILKITQIALVSCSTETEAVINLKISDTSKYCLACCTPSRLRLSSFDISIIRERLSLTFKWRLIQKKHLLTYLLSESIVDKLFLFFVLSLMFFSSDFQLFSMSLTASHFVHWPIWFLSLPTHVALWDLSRPPDLHPNFCILLPCVKGQWRAYDLAKLVSFYTCLSTVPLILFHQRVVSYLHLFFSFRSNSHKTSHELSKVIKIYLLKHHCFDFPVSPLPLPKGWKKMPFHDQTHTFDIWYTQKVTAEKNTFTYFGFETYTVLMNSYLSLSEYTYTEKSLACFLPASIHI